MYWGQPDTVPYSFFRRRILAFFSILMELSFPRKRIKMDIFEIVSSWIAYSSDWALEDDACHVWQDTTVCISTENTVLCSKYFTYFTHLILTATPEMEDNGFTDEDTEITSKCQAGSEVSCFIYLFLKKEKTIHFFFPLCFCIRRMECNIFAALDFLENLDIKFSRLSREIKTSFLGKFLGLMDYLF